MNILQKIFEDEMHEHLTLPVVGAELIRNYFNRNGVILNSAQIEKLKIELDHFNTDSSSADFLNFDIDFDDEQNKTLGINNGETIEIDLSDSDNELKKNCH
jgi:hypothetical protein